MSADQPILALDIGGTSIRGILVHGGRTVATAVRPSSRRADPGGSAATAMLRFLEGVAGGDLASVAAIGVAITGPVDTATGRVSNPYTLPDWSHDDWVEELRQRLGIPVVVENDAMSAAQGEFHAGAGRGSDVMCMVTLGTGIGVAVVSRAQGPYRGSARFHPEGGHLIIGAAGERCYCGEVGCLEELCSGGGIRKYWTGADGSVDWDGYGRMLAQGIRNLSRTFAPDRFVFGGGISDNFVDFAGALAEPFTQPDPMGLPDPPGFLKAQLDSPGMAGAAHLAAHALNAKENA